MLTTDVENFPGFPEGVMGPELMMRFREQAARFEADIRTEKVTRVDLSERPFKVWVGDPDAPEPTYLAQSIIVSTGAQSKMLGLGEERLIGHGVSTCATCDGFFFRDHHIVVVGGGDSAVEEAMFLSKFADTVTLVHRRDELRASKIMQDRIQANPKVRFRWNSAVEEVVGDTAVEAVVGQGRQHRRAQPARGHRPVRGHRPHAQHVAVRGPAGHGGRPATWSPDRAPPPTSTGSSPAATSRTTPTGRRSPPPARAAWRPSTPSAGSRPRALSQCPPRECHLPSRLQGAEPRRTSDMAEGINDLTDATFDEEIGGPTAPCSSTSGRSGAVPAR